MEYYILTWNLQCKAKKIGIKLSKKEILRRLHQFDSLACANGFKVCFSYFKTFPFESLEAKYTQRKIICSTGWAVKLVINNDEDTHNAFLVTLGHEISHRLEYKSKLLLNPRDRKFVNWVNEVHCDFSGAELMVQANRKRIVDSIRYKYSLKPNNKDSQSHPSWKRRLEYAKKYNFNKELLKRIAEDTGCTNQSLIHDVGSFFKSINLT